MIEQNVHKFTFVFTLVSHLCSTIKSISTYLTTIKAYSKFLLNAIYFSFFISLTGLLACSDNGEEIQKTVDRHVKQSSAYLKSGQYRAATIEAKNAIQKGPNNYSGHIALAKILNQLARYKQAVKHLEQLPEDALNTSDFAFTIAEAYLGRGKFNSADQVLTKQKAMMSKQQPAYDLLVARTQLGLKALDQATNLYESVLSTYPDNIEAIVALARLAAERSDFTTVDSLIERANTIAPSTPDVDFFLSQLYLFKKQYEDAENLLTEALSNLPNSDIMTPKKSAMLSLLAQTLTLQGKSAEALIYTRKIAEAFPGAEVAEGEFREASEFFDKGDFTKAEELLIKIVEDYPNFDEASVLLAVIKYRNGEIAEASKYFSDIIDPEIANPNITKLAALANLQSNQPEQVVNLLEKYSESNTDPQILILYGQAALSSKQAEKSESAFKKAIEINPKIPQAYIGLAEFYNNKQPADLQQALFHLRKGYQHDNTNFMLASALTRQLVLTKNIDDAKSLVEELLQRAEGKPIDTANALQLTGDFYQSQNQNNKAVNYYGLALENNQEDYDSAIKLAILIQAQGDFEATLKAYNRSALIDTTQTLSFEQIMIAAKNSANLTSAENVVAQIAEEQNSAAAYAVLARYFAEIGNLEKANSYSQLLDLRAPQSKHSDTAHLAIHYAQAQQHINANEIDAARDSILAGLTIDAKSPLFLVLLTEIEIHTKNYGEAQKLITEINRLNTNLATQLQGDYHYAQADNESAISAYQLAWQKQTNDTLGGKIYSLLASEKPKAASDFLLQWLDKIPNSISAKSLIATEYLLASNFDQAIPILEEIQIQAPTAAKNLNNLAWAYQQIGNPKALVTAELAYSLAPTSASIADTYGWILFGENNITEAIEILTLAANLEPENADIATHLEAARAAEKK